jgi:Meiotically up-regulated gene 113
MVYILQMGDHALLKIGQTMNLDMRVKELQIGCPEPLRVLRTYCCEKPQLIEVEVHRRLSTCRRQGEWFATDLITIDEIIRDISTPVWELTQTIDPVAVV